MEIRISTRHGNVSEQTRDRIAEKLGKLKRLFERLDLVELTIDLEHREAPRVDMKVSARYSRDFVASSQTGSLMSSVDDAVEKMEQQLRKYKEKLQDRHRSGHHRP